MRQIKYDKKIDNVVLFKFQDNNHIESKTDFDLTEFQF